TRLILRSCHSRCASDAESDICRLCSSSSKSPTVVPASTVPSRLIFPAWKSIASTSEVLPVPRWSTTATFRIFPGSCILEIILRGGLSRQRERPLVERLELHRSDDRVRVQRPVDVREEVTD